MSEGVTGERYVVGHGAFLVYVVDTATGNVVTDTTESVVYVSQPNWLERIFRVTWEQKIHYAVLKMQEIAEMYNTEEAVRVIKSKEVSEAYQKVFAGERNV